jgi:hypothetical protein
MIEAAVKHNRTISLILLVLDLVALGLLWYWSHYYLPHWLSILMGMATPAPAAMWVFRVCLSTAFDVVVVCLATVLVAKEFLPYRRLAVGVNLATFVITVGFQYVAWMALEDVFDRMFISLHGSYC